MTAMREQCTTHYLAPVIREHRLPANNWYTGRIHNLLTATNGNANLYLCSTFEYKVRVLYNFKEVALMKVRKKTSWCKFLQNLSCIVCVMCRDYRSGSQGDERSRDREYPLSRQKSDEGSLPPSRYNSRPPTRSGSRPSTADSLRHSIGGWIKKIHLIAHSSRISKKVQYYVFDHVRMLRLFIRCMQSDYSYLIHFVHTENQLHICGTI